MNEIGIRIFWGPWDGEFNPSPIVSLGNVAGGIVPSAPILVKEEKSWIIKTDERKALFVCHSKERCFNSDNYMQLLVCAIIPKGKRLSGEKSPLDLLEDIRSLFDQLFTVDLSADTLPHKEKVDADFTQLLKGYALTDCPWYVFNMEGDKPASFCVESRAQLNALMRYNAYPALAHIEHLELGFKCKTTVDINTKGQSNGGSKKENKSKWWGREDKEKEAKEEPMKESKKESKKGSMEESSQEVEKEKQVVAEKSREERLRENKPKEDVQKTGIKNVSFPLQPKYEVFVNGNSTGRFLQDQFDYYRAEIAGKDNPDIDVRYGFLNFTLGELLDSKTKTKQSQDGSVVVKLDEGLQRIDCTLKSIPVLYKKVLRFTNSSNDEAKKFFRNGLKDHSVKLMLNGKEWVNAEIKPSEAIGAIRDNHIDVFPHEVEGYRFSVDSVNLYVPEKGVVVTVKAKKVQRWQKRLIIGGIVALAVGIGGTLLFQKVAESISIERDVSLEFSAYQNADASNDTTIWKNYLEQYSAPMFKHPDESHLSRIEEKWKQARQEAVEAKKEAEAETAAYYRCIDEKNSLHDRIAACEFYNAEYTKRKTEVERLKKELEQQVLQINTDVDRAEIQAFQAVEKAMDKDCYPTNFKAFQKYKSSNYGNVEHDNKVNEYIKEIIDGRNDILGLLNRKDLVGFREKYVKNSKWKKYITIVECNAVESILDYRMITLKDHRREVMIRHEIKDYLESKGGLKFKNWDEVMKVKNEIDKIVSTYSNGNE